MEFSFDEESLTGADRNAARITDSGAYVGEFTRVSAVYADAGWEGLDFDFKSASGGEVNFGVITKSTEGKDSYGLDQVKALMYLMGVKDMKPVKGTVRKYINGKFADVEGEVFPQLCGKVVGVVLQKELKSKQNGQDSYRWNLYGQFDPVSKLTASELRDRVGPGKGQKLEKLLRGLKDKDSRKAKTAEPDQPSMGVPEGGY